MSELSIFKTLARNCLQSTINRYLRFRDDVSVHVVGTPDDICKAIKVICTGYPKDIIFNMETKIIQGRFFEYKNIKLSIYNNTIHTVLRKQNNKYNIIPPNSNVAWKYKKMAGNGYFRTARTHCSTSRERNNQYKIIHHILRLKGFSKNQISKIQNPIKSDKKQDRNLK